MFVLNDDLSIHATRGDIVFFTVQAEQNGKTYTFKAGDLIRFKVYGKKNAKKVVMQEDFTIVADCTEVEIYLDETKTKFGGVISKPTDFWYEVELNPLSNPQTIIGYDEDGPKIFKLFPEGADDPEIEITEEDIPFVDSELDLTSERPVQNQAATRAIVQLRSAFEALNAASVNMANTMALEGARTDDEIAVERARINNIVNGNTPDGAEVTDIRVGAGGNTYSAAGEAVRVQMGQGYNAQKAASEKGQTTFAPFTEFTQQGLTNGALSYAPYRISTISSLCFNRDITINIASGFKIGIHTLTDEGGFVADSGWKQGTYTVKAGQWFKLVIARVTETPSVPADYVEFCNAVTFDTVTTSEIKRLDSDMNKRGEIFSNIVGMESIEIVGAYFTTGGAGHLNNRIHASDFVCEGLAVIEFIAPDKEYLYGVDLYTNDGMRKEISKSGWMNTSEMPRFIVNENCVIDLSVSKVTTLSFDSLTEMDGLFKVTKYDTLAAVRASMSAAPDNTTDTKITRKKAWLTSAHQGFVDANLRPNTLAAYYNAYLNGADMIETDARISKDGVLIVCHDPTITGTLESGGTATYTIADTSAEDICNLILTSNEKWGVQKVPTLEQVLNLAYHTGMIVNIDMKNGMAAVDAILDLVAKCGMLGKVIYATNGTGATSIEKILARDPDAKFIDVPSIANHVANNPKLVGKCYAYTADVTKADEIRASGCLLALISLHANNFKAAIEKRPDMCEYLHTSDFKAIEDAYFDELRLY